MTIKTVFALAFTCLFLTTGAMAQGAYKELGCDSQEAAKLAASYFSGQMRNWGGVAAPWDPQTIVAYNQKDGGGRANMSTWGGNIAVLINPRGASGAYNSMSGFITVRSYAQTYVSACLFTFPHVKSPNYDQLDFRKARAIATLNGKKRKNFSIPATSWADWARGKPKVSTLKLDLSSASFNGSKRYQDIPRHFVMVFVSANSSWSTTSVKSIINFGAWK